MNKLNPYMKAVVAAVGAGLSALIVVVVGDTTLAQVTTAQWLIVALAVIGSGGATWRIPNKPA